MTLLRVNEWISQRIICDQTNLINEIISFDQNIVTLHVKSETKSRLENVFLSWSNKDHTVDKSNLILNYASSNNWNSIDDLQIKIQNLFDSSTEDGFYRYIPSINVKLIKALSQLQNLQKKKILSNTFVKQFAESVSWKLLDNLHFAILLQDFGLPVFFLEKNFWWGHFSESSPYYLQDEFYSAFGSLKLNPLEPITSSVADLRCFLEEKNLMQMHLNTRESRGSSTDVINQLSRNQGEKKSEQDIRRGM